MPAAIIIWLGFHLVPGTHRLDPYNPIDTGVTPLEVQAVAQDWKWLFIYPEQNIAVVNELVFPAGRPLAIKITSDTVMNSLAIPALGGQIYAMAGMQTRLHLLANEPAEMWGRNVQYSGAGFADQQFRAVATTQDDFEAWVAKAKSASAALDAGAYETLAKPSQEGAGDLLLGRRARPVRPDHRQMAAWRCHRSRPDHPGGGNGKMRDRGTLR